jgi:dipeptidase E
VSSEAVVERIVAIGGGGFLMESKPSALDAYIVSIANVKRPRICFVPTASGDSHEQIDKFYAAFARFPAQLSHLSFFRKPTKGAILLNRFELDMLDQHVIYVGGGNTRSMLAVWREWGLTKLLRAALKHGVVLAGVSAGAICWFDWGASDSAAPGVRSTALRCLGFLKGSCSPHWGGEPHRRRDFHALVRSGALPAGYGIADGAAMLFEGNRLVDTVSCAPSAGVFRVELLGDRLRETQIAARPIA